MDYEKKYKALVEAVKMLKEANPSDEGIQNRVNDNVPELKESEDERIRKALIHLVNSNKELSFGIDNYDGIKWSDILAWLEKQGKKDEEILVLKDQIESLHAAIKAIKSVHKIKLEKQGEQKLPIEKLSEEMKTIGESLGFTTQEECDRYNQMVTDLIMSDDDKGEQKPIDKVKPKFKNGQWIVWRGNCYKVNYNGCGYELVDKNGLSTSLEYGTIDENAHLWDITKDVKDGDVLCCESGWTCIFKALDNQTNTFSSYCFMDSDKWFCNTGSECHTLDKAFIEAYNGEIYPATKEQRDNLMKAMADAGYTFDFEKKELRKIEQKHGLSY